MTVAATPLAPSTGGSAFTQRGPDVIGAPQFDRRLVVEIGAEPKKGDLAVKPGFNAVLTINGAANDLRIKGRMLKPWAQPLAISEINIYNMSEERRALIEGKTRVPVRFLGGYGSSLRLVGTISGVQCSSEFLPSGDVITKIEGTNGGPRLLKDVEIRLGIGKPYAEAIIEMANQLGGIGASAVKLVKQAAAGRIYQSGYSSQGRLIDEFTTALTDIGLEWTVVDDEVLIAEKDGTTGELFIVSPESGLIGSPVPDSPPAPGKLRFLRARCLMNPTFKPGARLQLRSAIHSGFFACWDVAHEFDTWGGEWYSSLQLKALKGAR